MHSEREDRITSTDRDLLIRMDERMGIIHATLMSRLDSIEKIMVTQKEFRPVKSIVYGLISLLGTTVFLALLATVLT
jgi:hypothetical protein